MNRRLIIALSIVIIACLSLSSCGGGSGSAPAEPLSASEVQQLYTSPKQFKGRPVELTGSAFSVERDGDGVYFQMWQDIKNSENNTIVAYADPEFELSSGDFVKVIGVVKDEFKGTNAFGATITAPAIKAESVEVLSYIDVMAPTLREVVPEPNVIDQHGYRVTIDKIEFSKPETRVYVKVENNGADKFSLYSFNSLIIQDGRQYEEQDNWDADYPRVQSSLSAGVTTEGIICFPPLSESNFKIILEGRSDDWMLKFAPYEYEVIME
jgi:hypothetical protein